MEKSRLYTGGGDTGMTSLVGGQRVRKDSMRLDAYGTVDEFSAFLGAVLSNPDCPGQIREDLLSIQNLLFDIGCILATDPAGPQYAKPIGEEEIGWLEKRIDELDAATPKMNCFVLPGGTPLSAQAQIARAVCRRAERRILALANAATAEEDAFGEKKITAEQVPAGILKWFNRLSDYLFILARHFNYLAGVPDIPWTPR